MERGSVRRNDGKGFFTPPCHTGRMATIAKLHDKAKSGHCSGRRQLSAGRRYLAAARERARHSAQSAKAIGKSPAGLITFLKWRSGGYRETPFEPAVESEARHFQSTKQPKRRPMTAEEALAQKAQAEFQTERAEAVTAMFGAGTKRIPAAARAELLKALRMLVGSRRRRASAALIVERQRARLNLTWNDLLVPPNR